MPRVGNSQTSTDSSLRAASNRTERGTANPSQTSAVSSVILDRYVRPDRDDVARSRPADGRGASASVARAMEHADALRGVADRGTGHETSRRQPLNFRPVRQEVEEARARLHREEHYSPASSLLRREFDALKASSGDATATSSTPLRPIGPGSSMAEIARALHGETRAATPARPTTAAPAIERPATPTRFGIPSTTPRRRFTVPDQTTGSSGASQDVSNASPATKSSFKKGLAKALRPLSKAIDAVGTKRGASAARSGASGAVGRGGAPVVRELDLTRMTFDQAAQAVRTLSSRPHIDELRVDATGLNALTRHHGGINMRLRALTVVGTGAGMDDTSPYFPSLQTLHVVTSGQPDAALNAFIERTVSSSPNLEVVDLGRHELSRDAALHLLDNKFVNLVSSANFKADTKADVHDALVEFTGVAPRALLPTGAFDASRGLAQYNEYEGFGDVWNDRRT